MASDPQMRASDEDRDRTSALLREHHAAGRLTVDEFQERLDATYAAKTLGELDAQLKDLPGIDLYQLPDVKMRRDQAVSPATPGRLSPAWRAAWGSWISTSLVLFVIWLITSSGGHSLNGLWFLWVAGPWGAILLGRWLTGGHPDGHQGHSHHGHSLQNRNVDSAPGELGGAQPGQADLVDDDMQREDERFARDDERYRREAERLRRREEHLRRRAERMRRGEH